MIFYIIIVVFFLFSFACAKTEPARIDTTKIGVIKIVAFLFQML